MIKLASTRLWLRAYESAAPVIYPNWFGECPIGEGDQNKMLRLWPTALAMAVLRVAAPPVALSTPAATSRL